MALHFNLKSILALSLGLAVWQFFVGYTLASGVVLATGYGIYLWRLKKLTAADVILLAAGLMNLWYVVSSWENVRQHDYYNFVMFADYFVTNHFFVAPFTSYLKSVFFHPPVWGLMTGLFMKFLEFDAVRFISLGAILATYVLMWRLLTDLCIKEKIKLWLFLFYCFYPANGYMSNWVNNDAAVYFLMIATIYQVFRWYDDCSLKRTLWVFGLLILSGMTKFSGLMVVPAIGVLMLFKLLNSPKKTDAALWGKFVIIGLGAVLGFAWGIFLLYFHLPLLPQPQDVGIQSMKAYSLYARLFDFGGLLTPIVDFKAHFEVEPNVWLTLIKTSLFGEWGWQGLLWAKILYGLAYVWLLLAVSGFVYLFFKPIKKDYAFNGALIVLFFSVLIAWINFWLDYPYFCSTEFRYTAIFLPISVLWVGHFLTNKNLPKYGEYTLAGLIVIFVVARFMLYLHTI